MGRITFTRAEVEARRRQVARLYLRQRTQQEIGDELGVNQSTICRDLSALRRQWQAQSLVDTDEHIARQLAELREVKRSAWGGKPPDLAAVLRALAAERELLGLGTTNLTLSGPAGGPVEIVYVNDWRTHDGGELSANGQKALPAAH